MLNSISKLVKFISSRFLLFILGIFLATGATYVYATWTSPTLAPPEGNIAALINTSNTGQAKQGGLILNTGGSANGLIVQFGNVGIGTTSPGAKLEVIGNIIADAPTASNHLATMGYVDASSGGGGCFDQYHYAWCTTHQDEKCAKSGTMDYKCIGDFCTKASISNDMDGDGITAATDCDDDDIIIVAAVDGTCDGDADGKIDQTAYTAAIKPALADCYDSDPSKYLCLSNGTVCSSGIYCASTYCIDGYCCDNACDYTCVACDVAGSIGACTNVPVDTDPAIECSEFTCTNYIYGGTNPSCYRYASATSHNGMCNGEGACYTSVADSCTGQGSATITCGNTACWKACVADSPVTSYDNYSEVCYTSGTQECTGGLACNSVGDCKKLNGTACTAGSECADGYCVDDVCCNTACSGSICQTCGTYSSAGVGSCGYVNSSAQDPDNECTTASPPNANSCKSATCSGTGYSCGYLAVGERSQPACKRCSGSSYNPVNIAIDLTDGEGSYLCNGTCQYCDGGGTCRTMKWTYTGQTHAADVHTCYGAAYCKPSALNSLKWWWTSGGTCDYYRCDNYYGDPGDTAYQQRCDYQ